MKYFKNITEAMAELRPKDKIEFVLDNKFVIVRAYLTTGGFAEPCIMFLHKNAVYSFCMYASSAQRMIQYYASRPNIERVPWCFDHSKNGKPNHWLIKTADNRPLKKIARKLQRVLMSNHPTLADMNFEVFDEVYSTKLRSTNGLINIIWGHLMCYDDGVFEAVIVDDFEMDWEEKVFDDIPRAITWINNRVKELAAESENQSQFAYITDATTLL